MTQSKTSMMSMQEVQSDLALDRFIKLIDVRTPFEFCGGHLPRAINIPLEKAWKIESIISDKNRKLYVYCQTGARSKKACSIFEKIGYTNITNIGGIGSWKGEIIYSL